MEKIQAGKYVELVYEIFVVNAEQQVSVFKFNWCESALRALFSRRQRQNKNVFYRISRFDGIIL